MIIRVPINGENSLINNIYKTPGNAVAYEAQDSKTESASGTTSDALSVPTAEINSSPQVKFTLTPATIPEYHSSRYSHPVCDINVTIPDNDKPTVASWFGNTPLTSAVSDTLIKRMTTAVLGAAETYFNTSARMGLFTRPFRIGWALLTDTGKLIQASAPETLLPNDRAPVMAIRQNSHSGDFLETVTEIRNLPQTLSVTVRAFTLPSELVSRVTHLVIFATAQSDVFTGEESVTAVRTYVVDNTNVPGWYYPRMSAALVLEKTQKDTSFRIIGKIPIAEAMAGTGPVVLPAERTDLTEWIEFPKVEDIPGITEPDIPDLPLTPPERILMETVALDLGMPERAKRILGLTVRGIFPRLGENVTVTLYGAHHRPYSSRIIDSEISESADSQNSPVTDSGSSGFHGYGQWHKIATSRGPHIRLLRTVRYRWLRVTAEAPYPASFDAISFLIK